MKANEIAAIAEAISLHSKMTVDEIDVSKVAEEIAKETPNTAVFFATRGGMDSFVGLFFAHEGAIDFCTAMVTNDGYRMQLCVEYLIKQLQAGGCKINDDTEVKVIG